MDPLGLGFEIAETEDQGSEGVWAVPFGELGRAKTLGRWFCDYASVLSFNTHRFMFKPQSAKVIL